MPNTSERPTDDTEAIVHTYGNTLYRICLVMLGSEADAEDALQETFLRYFRSAPQFNNSDHKKSLADQHRHLEHRFLTQRKSHPPGKRHQVNDISQMGLQIYGRKC